MTALDLLPTIQVDLECAAKSDACVLLTGGTSDLRTAVARCIHAAGRQADAPMIVLGADETWPEIRATFFVQEIADLQPADQQRLMQWLDARARARLRDRRVIVGTRYSASELLGREHVGEALFFRLNTIQIALGPPAGCYDAMGRPAADDY